MFKSHTVLNSIKDFFSRFFHRTNLKNLTRKTMNCKIAHVGVSETWRTRLLIRSSIIINFLLFVLTANTKANNLYCNPNDPTSCSFSGVCKRPDLKVGTAFERNSFVCSCPNMNCQSFGYQPECGSDGM